MGSPCRLNYVVCTLAHGSAYVRIIYMCTYGGTYVHTLRKHGEHSIVCSMEYPKGFTCRTFQYWNSKEMSWQVIPFGYQMESYKSTGILQSRLLTQNQIMQHYMGVLLSGQMRSSGRKQIGIIFTFILISVIRGVCHVCPCILCAFNHTIFL